MKKRVIFCKILSPLAIIYMFFNQSKAGFKKMNAP